LKEVDLPDGAVHGYQHIADLLVDRDMLPSRVAFNGVFQSLANGNDEFQESK
jgi:hypothetical protein